MKNRPFLLLIAFTAFWACSGKQESGKAKSDGLGSEGSGLEFFQVERTVIDLTKEDAAGCLYCLDLKTEDLYETPLLNDKDIKAFDWESQQVELSAEAEQRMDSLKIPLEGLPMAMVLDGAIVYGLWFWNERSSFGCDRVYTYPRLGFQIKFGLPGSNTFGSDPRFDEGLRQYANDKRTMK